AGGLFCCTQTFPWILVGPCSNLIDVQANSTQSRLPPAGTKALAGSVNPSTPSNANVPTNILFRIVIPLSSRGLWSAASACASPGLGSKGFIPIVSPWSWLWADWRWFHGSLPRNLPGSVSVSGDASGFAQADAHLDDVLIVKLTLGPFL